MKTNYFLNIQILILFTVFSFMIQQGIHFSPLGIDEEENVFNPLNHFFGINNIAKDIISKHFFLQII